MDNWIRYRLCGAGHVVFDCNDVAAQTCVARLVGVYLDAIRWGVLTDHADDGPGDWMAIGGAERSAFPSVSGFEHP
jgi:hypothetical protein